MYQIKAFTDGSCNYKNGHGGAGVYGKVWKDKELIQEINISDAYSNTKTGRMEITAVISLLLAIDESIRSECSVEIISDSQYVVNSISKGWIQQWKLDGWYGKANADLWEEFIELYDQFPLGAIKIVWVKGHNGNEGNEKADSLARAAYKIACSGGGVIDQISEPVQ